MMTKAPERSKREIVNTPIKMGGGFGMIDGSILDRSVKLKAIGRAVGSEHPLGKKVMMKVDFGDYFYPVVNNKIDQYFECGIRLLGELEERALQMRRLKLAVITSS